MRLPIDDRGRLSRRLLAAEKLHDPTMMAPDWAVVSSTFKGYRPLASFQASRFVPLLPPGSTTMIFLLIARSMATRVAPNSSMGPAAGTPGVLAMYDSISRTSPAFSVTAANRIAENEFFP